jgi:hypothetical protein
MALRRGAASRRRSVSKARAVRCTLRLSSSTMSRSLGHQGVDFDEAVAEADVGVRPREGQARGVDGREEALLEGVRPEDRREVDEGLRDERDRDAAQRADVVVCERTNVVPHARTGGHPVPVRPRADASRALPEDVSTIGDRMRRRPCSREDRRRPRVTALPRLCPYSA